MSEIQVEMGIANSVRSSSCLVCKAAPANLGEVSVSGFLAYVSFYLSLPLPLSFTDCAARSALSVLMEGFSGGGNP
jgi:hypothetical protein